MSFLKELKEEDKKSKKKTVKKKEELKKKSELSSLDGQLVVDVYETKDNFYVRAPIAGVESDEIDVTVENGMLIIKGERKYEEEKKEKNYFYQECYWGSFSRQILLPDDVDSSKIKASLEKGVLTVKLPKSPKTKKKKVSIDVKD